MASYFDASTRSTFIATGQQATSPLLVWDSATLRTIASIPTKQKTITQLAFSGDGRLLVSVGGDNSVIVSDWRGQRIVVEAKGDPATTFHIACAKSDASNFKFVTAGDKFIRVWTLSGRNLTSTKVPTTGGPKGCSVQLFLCAAEYQRGVYIVGCEDGSLYRFKEDSKNVLFRNEHYTQKLTDKKVADVKDKSGSVTALHCFEETIVSGGKNGLIRIWQAAAGTDDLVSMYQINLQDVSVGLCGIRQISALSLNGSFLLVGTKGCEVLEVALSTIEACDGGKTLSEEERAVPLITGHCSDELWGLATHPLKAEFCSVGDDRTLRVWDSCSHRQTAVVPLDAMARACAYDPTGGFWITTPSAAAVCLIAAFFFP